MSHSTSNPSSKLRLTRRRKQSSILLLPLWRLSRTRTRSLRSSSLRRHIATIAIPITISVAVSPPDSISVIHKEPQHSSQANNDQRLQKAHVEAQIVVLVELAVGMNVTCFPIVGFVLQERICRVARRLIGVLLRVGFEEVLQPG